MKKYLTTSTKTPGELTFEFNAAGQLIKFESTMELDEKGFNWLAKNFPLIESEMDTLANNLKTIQIMDRITFADFYKAYGNKVGKKEAERTWNKLSEADQVKAYAYIRIYNSRLVQTPGIAKLYPATYLNAQRWND